MPEFRHDSGITYQHIHLHLLGAIFLSVSILKPGHMSESGVFGGGMFHHTNEDHIPEKKVRKKKQPADPAPDPPVVKKMPEKPAKRRK
jgi:hypothetical protein